MKLYDTLLICYSQHVIVLIPATLKHHPKRNKVFTKRFVLPRESISGKHKSTRIRNIKNVKRDLFKIFYINLLLNHIFRKLEILTIFTAISDNITLVHYSFCAFGKRLMVVLLSLLAVPCYRQTCFVKSSIFFIGA